MIPSLFPFQYLIAALALLMNRQQQDVIDYLKEENRLLKAKLGDRKIQFTDAERCRLAIRANALGRKLLGQLETWVTPDSLLRWHRQLVAQKWNFVHRRAPGRPRIKDEIAALILRMAEDNPSWGYTRILGALHNLGYQVSRGTVANVLEENDFFSVEVRRLSGLTTYYVLFFIQLSTRTVRIAGMTTHPNEAWMLQMGRNITDSETGLLLGKCKLIVDRDTKYCSEFRQLLEQSGAAIIRLPPRSPNLNAYAERFVRSITAECVQRMIFFGEASLRQTLLEFTAHDHQERNHQGMSNRRLNSAANDDSYQGAVVSKRARLGGILNYNYGEAA